MADILFVCVRKDLAQADALADMFQAAGFSIGDLPESAAELGAAGAALLVWSQAASDSSPFHEAAARVLAAGRAVFATLDASSPPANLGATPFFDLSGWRGDPDDSLLDPLFAVIDKMATERRAELERWGAAAGRRDTGAVLEGRHDAVVHDAEAGAFAFAGSEPDPGAPAKLDRQRRDAPRSTKGSTANRRRPEASAGRGRTGGAMLIPLLASASIAAAAYFGGLAESRNAPEGAHAVRVAIPPPQNANLVRLSAPAIEMAAPDLAQEPQAPPQAAAADDASVSVAAAEPPRRRLRVRAPSVRLRTLSSAFRASLQTAALAEPSFVELEPVVFARRGRMMRIRAETLDSKARTASAHLLEGVRVESAALANTD